MYILFLVIIYVDMVFHFLNKRFKEQYVEDFCNRFDVGKILISFKLANWKIGFTHFLRYHIDA